MLRFVTYALMARATGKKKPRERRGGKRGGDNVARRSLRPVLFLLCERGEKSFQREKKKKGGGSELPRFLDLPLFLHSAGEHQKGKS